MQTGAAETTAALDNVGKSAASATAPVDALAASTARLSEAQATSAELSDQIAASLSADFPALQAVVAAEEARAQASARSEAAILAESGVVDESVSQHYAEVQAIEAARAAEAQLAAEAEQLVTNFAAMTAAEASWTESLTVGARLSAEQVSSLQSIGSAAAASSEGLSSASAATSAFAEREASLSLAMNQMVAAGVSQADAVSALTSKFVSATDATAAYQEALARVAPANVEVAASGEQVAAANSREAESFATLNAQMDANVGTIEELRAARTADAGSTEQEATAQQQLAAAQAEAAATAAEQAGAETELAGAENEAGAGATAMAGSMEILIAATAAFIGLKLAEELQTDQVRFQNFGQVSSGALSDIEGQLNHTFGLGTDSAISFFNALTPVSGALQQVEGGTITYAQTAQIAAQAQDLAAASGVSLKAAFADVVLTMRDFSASASQSKEFTDALYDSSVRDSKSVDDMAQAYGFAHAQLEGINPSLTLVKQLVDNAAQAGSDNQRVLNAETKAVLDYSEGSKSATAELEKYGLQLTTVNGQLQLVGHSTDGLRSTESDASGQTDTLGGAIKILGSSAEDAATFVGQGLAYAVIALAKTLPILGSEVASVALEIAKLTHNSDLAQWAESFQGSSQSTMSYLDNVAESLRTTQKAQHDLGQSAAQEGPPISLIYQGVAVSAQNAKLAFEAETKAQQDDLKGKTDLAAAERALEAAYNTNDATKIESAQRNLALAETQDQVNTKLGKEAVTAAKAAETAANQYGAALRTLSTDQSALEKATDSLNQEIAGKTAIVTQDVLNGDATRVASATSSAQATLAAWSAAVDAEAADQAAGNLAAQKIDQDHVDSAKAAAQTEASNLKEALQTETQDRKTAETEARNEASATQKFLDDSSKAMKAQFDDVNTSMAKIPDNVEQMFEGTAAVIQDKYRDIINIDNQLRQQLSDNDRAELNNKRDQLEGELTEWTKVHDEAIALVKDIDAAAKQSATDQKAVTTDIAAAQKDQHAANEKELAAENSLIKDEDAEAVKLSDDLHKAAEAAQKDAQAISDAAGKVADAQAKLSADMNAAAANVGNIQGPASFAMPDFSGQASAASDVTNQLQQQVDIENSVKSAAQSVLDAEAEQLKSLQDQNTTLSAQLSLANDLLAVNGQTDATDKTLLQLQLQKDQATAAGQTTTEIDKQIAAEQAKNKVAQDTVNLQNVDLQTQLAQNKVAQDKLNVGNDSINQAKQQVAASTTVLAGLQSQLDASKQADSAAQSAANSAQQVAQQQQQSAQAAAQAATQQSQASTDQASKDKTLLDDQKQLKTANEDLGKAQQKAYQDAQDAARKYSEDAAAGQKKISDASAKVAQDQSDDTDKIKQAWEKVTTAQDKAAQDATDNETKVHAAQTELQGDLNNLATQGFPGVSTAAAQTGTDINTFSTQSANHIEVQFQQPASASFATFQQNASGSLGQIASDTDTQMKSAVTSVTTQIGAAGDGGDKFGESIDLGMVSGINNMASAVVNAGVNLVTEVFAAMRSAAQIASPSQVTQEIGDFLGQGLSKGLAGQTAGVSGAASDLVTAAIQPIITGANAQIMQVMSIRSRLIGLLSSPNQGDTNIQAQEASLRGGLKVAEQLGLNFLQGAGGFGGLGLPSFAGGGTSSGGLAMVGERGPEIVALPSGSQVIPNHAIGSFADGTPGYGSLMGGDIHNHFYVDGTEIAIAGGRAKERARRVRFASPGGRL